MVKYMLMEDKNKTPKNEDIIIDEDKIDINEPDEVIADDIISEDSVNSDNEDFEETNISEEKTIGDALDESETETKAAIFKPDLEVDAAVDDIVRSESDESLAEADAKIAALQATKTKKTFKQKIKSVFMSWWGNKPVRNGTLAALLVVFAAVILLPTTRYGVLNAFGVRVSSSMIVVDSQTRLPLKNINVNLQAKSGSTNEKGEILFNDLKLGKSNLLVSKRGYADTKEEVVLGLGSNPIGEKEMIATGEQFTFVLSDWKSGKPITDAEASSGENSANADDSGKIVLTIGEENISQVEVSLIADGYRTELFRDNQLVDSEIVVKMVPAKKHTFISNRNGDFDLYRIDLDGKNEEVLLKASGQEREVPNIVPHPSKDIIALVTSRSGEANKDGFILDGLYVVDVNSKPSDEEGDTKKRIARSEQLQVLGWSGDNLVFLQIVEGTSAGNDERSKIVSYNIDSGERIDLAKANYFNDAKLIENQLYYAVSSFSVPQSQAKLFVTNIDGKSARELIDSQVWNIFRTEYSKLIFSAEEQKWFSLDFGNLVEEIDRQLAPVSLNFIDSPDKKRTTWVEVRDGKGVLLKSNTDEFKEEYVKLYKTSRASASTLKARLLTAYQLLGYKREDRSKLIDKWLIPAKK
jgi:hypothetical protein